jgi:hypothetical protein
MALPKSNESEYAVPGELMLQVGKIMLLGYPSQLKRELKP